MNIQLPAEPDQNLRAAIAEIKAIIKKRDIAAVVYLTSPIGLEYLHEISPSWSCARLEGSELRFRAKAAEFPNKEAQKKTIEDTAGMFLAFIEAMENFIKPVRFVIAHIASQSPIDFATRELQPPEE